jgi:hypothetical protein
VIHTTVVALQLNTLFIVSVKLYIDFIELLVLWTLRKSLGNLCDEGENAGYMIGKADKIIFISRIHSKTVTFIDVKRLVIEK